MGLLSTGEPLSWCETKKHSENVRRRGIKQFIKLYHTFKSRDYDYFKYGDEVEYCLVKFDHENKRVYLLLKAQELLPELNNEIDNNNQEKVSKWMPEFASFMIEGLPGRPYEHDISDITKIEQNMKLRREQVQKLLGQDEFIMTFTTFPLLGCPEFTWPRKPTTPGKGITSSMFFPDDAIFQGHPKYAITVINNRERRQAKMSANIPIFMDVNTPKPFNEDLSTYGDLDYSDDLKLDHIYLEGIGASCSCLQVTFQATNMDEARLLYDQLTPLTPIMLALSAASPIWRGYLSDIDCRWQVISQALDDRTPEEKGHLPLKNDRYRIFKSRYDSVSCYLTEYGNQFNDIDVVKHEEFYKNLIEQDVDHLMAQHISHLFIRDPLVLFKENIDLNNDEHHTEHFENIQSTNWQSMRFKPPPSCDSNSNVGWRVEFRTTELQTTDFENASFAVFLVLLTRVILSFKLDLLIPISKVDENMKRAQKRDACLNEKFYFKTNKLNKDSSKDNDYIIEEMSIDEIINGCESYIGLIPLIKNYLSQLDVDLKTNCKLTHYLKLIESKADGTVKTAAAYMRDFVMKHKSYKFDSKVTNEIAYDLMWHLNQISSHNVNIFPGLIGS